MWWLEQKIGDLSEWNDRERLQKCCQVRYRGTLTYYLLVWSADNLCKQFGPIPGPTKCLVWSGSNLFDTQVVFLKEFIEKVDFEKNQQMTKKHEKFPGGKELMSDYYPPPFPRKGRGHSFFFSSVRWTERPAIPIAVDLWRKATKQTNRQTNFPLCMIQDL